MPTFGDGHDLLTAMPRAVRGKGVMMIRYLFGGFLILHGLVHMLYFGHSAKIFELQAGMTWPEGSWILSRLLGGNPTRLLASVLLILAALGLVAGGVAILFGQSWWRPVVVGTLMLSSVLYLVMWNGQFRRLDNQGGIGILINIGILLAVIVFRWPTFTF
jgi:uncharacterized membrane protein YphA (DoxX/SURF4 family)